jgi:hypothetical protein
MRVSPNKPPRFSASALLSLASIIPIRTKEGKPPTKKANPLQGEHAKPGASETRKPGYRMKVQHCALSRAPALLLMLPLPVLISGSSERTGKATRTWGARPTP